MILVTHMVHSGVSDSCIHWGFIESYREEIKNALTRNKTTETIVRPNDRLFKTLH